MRKVRQNIDLNTLRGILCMNCNGGVLMSNKQNATLNITGMTCAACSNRIEND